MSRDALLDELNPQQKEAIVYCKGPLLVLAGAGSGKTRVITRKFAYLVKKKKIPADSIFTVTFTNKAANEMKERICDLIGSELRHSWIGTFHSQCTRVLRREIKALGYLPDFSIYDDDDQCHMIRHILREMNIHEALYKGVASRISVLKSSCVTPEQFLSSGDGFSFDEKLGRVYLRYEDEMKRSNALDFDDLIMLTVRLFEEHPAILSKYTKMLGFVLVDEFQDINRSQYRLLRLLSSKQGMICAVGDDDQSIYKFRGADTENIRNFESDFSGIRIIKLEQNYRSTQHILDVSGAIIEKNHQRKPKTLWTDRASGDKVFYCQLGTEEEEARHVVRMIKDFYLKGKYEYHHFAVLYRIGMQSRAIEDALRHEVIPYHVIGGTSFYQRREIRDVIAYFRLIVNQNDNVSFRRIVNVPVRGIGPATIAKIETESKKRSLALFPTLKIIVKSNGIATALKEKLTDFVSLIDSLSAKNHTNAGEMLRSIVEKTNYTNGIEEDRIHNVNELIHSSDSLSVKDFIDKMALSSPSDRLSRDKSVSLLTLHSAKGLEFPVVFIIGLEEGILPYFKAIDLQSDIQEERRLLYVGMTRARDVLCISSAGKRRIYSKIKEQEPSRFLFDIPKNCCHWIERFFERPQEDSAVVRPVAVPVRPVYLVGSRVKHPSWGIGVVRDCFGDGEETKVTVNFPGIGVKRLAARCAQLERI